MHGWQEALRASVASGLWAATLSTLVIAACGRRDDGDGAGVVAAPSKWVLGDNAAYVRDPGPAQTLLGHCVHTAATIFWAALFERWRMAQRVPEAPGVVVRGAAVTAAAACLCDYNLTPRRFTPGFERRLSRRSLFWVYASIAAGLASWRMRAPVRNLPSRAP
jgi:hypothetical protein